MKVALLEIEGLKTQFFTSAGTVRAVDGVDYTVEEGETVAVVGESGCGKSVTALSIMRLVADPPGAPHLPTAPMVASPGSPLPPRRDGR